MRASGRTIAGLVLTVGATASLAACDVGGGRGPAPQPTSASPSVYGCAVPATGPVDAGSVLVPGPTNGLPPSDARGEKLIIAGVVLDAACRAVEGVSLRVWHTDARGRYGPAGIERCCYYAGTVPTDRNGRFRLDTVRPGQYGSAPEHVHVEIQQAPNPLQTKIVFRSEPVPTVAIRTGSHVPITLRRASGTDPEAWYGEVVFVLDR